MTDPRDMTTGEAEAWRLGWEAARDAACAVIQRRSDANAVSTVSRDASSNHIEAEDILAAIRAMQPPAQVGKGAGE